MVGVPNAIYVYLIKYSWLSLTKLSYKYLNLCLYYVITIICNYITSILKAEKDLKSRKLQTFPGSD